METVKRCCKIKEGGKNITQVSDKLISGKALLKQTENKSRGKPFRIKMLMNIAFANILMKVITTTPKPSNQS